jgi:hypothetical protein
MSNALPLLPGFTFNDVSINKLSKMYRKRIKQILLPAIKKEIPQNSSFWTNEGCCNVIGHEKY